MSTLYLMVGIPGSGKSTAVKRSEKIARELGKKYYTVSRDAIRFSMLHDEQRYFDVENYVFREFVRQINEALHKDVDFIYVDATHISEASRKKILTRLTPLPDAKLRFVEIECPLEVAIKRNEARDGRAHVPEEAIRRMESVRTSPTTDNHPDNCYGFSEISYMVVKYEGEWSE